MVGASKADDCSAAAGGAAAGAAACNWPIGIQMER